MLLQVSYSLHEMSASQFSWHHLAFYLLDGIIQILSEIIVEFFLISHSFDSYEVLFIHYY